MKSMQSLTSAGTLSPCLPHVPSILQPRVLLQKCLDGLVIIEISTQSPSVSFKYLGA